MLLIQILDSDSLICIIGTKENNSKMISELYVMFHICYNNMQTLPVINR